MQTSRVGVRKMYKLFINGAFVRSESGQSDPYYSGDTFWGNVARGSRKDVRDAVVAARAAQQRWWSMTPANRGLVLYRLAEMLEARSAELEQLTGNAAEVAAAIDRTVWYAGWCDKYNALLSTRNPVSSRHFNFSTAEPQGVVGILAPDKPPLLALVSAVLPPLVAGNAVVVVASATDPLPAIAFSEAVATSDVPPGVVNVLTGPRADLGSVLARHMDVDAIAFWDESLREQLQNEAAANVKRVHAFDAAPVRDWFDERAQSLDLIAGFSEIKTIWHPAGI